MGEYTIHMEAWDIAENHLMYNYTVKGFFSGVLDFLKDIWNAVTGALSAAWNAVTAALSWFLEFIWNNIVSPMIQGAIDIIVEPIKGWVQQFVDIIKENFVLIHSEEESKKSNIGIDSNGDEKDTIDAPFVTKAFESVTNFLTIPILTLSILTYALYIIEGIIKIFTAGMENWYGP